VLYELEYGVAKSSAPEHRRAQLAALVAVTDVLPFGAAEAAVAGRIRADLERAGTPIGAIDTLIGATALSHGATLVTRNVREFGRIQGLAVESWF
jgi:tRNA(fMet)-specific endonuclease VapC